MSKKWGTAMIILIILAFLGYIVFDVAFNDEKKYSSASPVDSTLIPDKWYISKIFEPGTGELKTVAVSDAGNILLAGDSFITSYNPEYKSIWSINTDKPVTALSVSGDTVFAATFETILILNGKGEIKDEWGPFEDNSIITSITSNNSYIAFADAGNKIIMVLDKKGNLKFMFGKSGEPFILPSAYFDVALGADNTLYAANTGNRRIETRTTDGTLLGYFGEPGLAPGAFCGCCNPAHFAIIPGGFITAEKGINRIKIINEKGDFVEFVSSENKFIASIPLDVASFNGKIIYAANPADSKLYEFRRK